MYFTLILLLMGLCYSQSTPFSGINWHSLSSEEKQSILYSNITEERNSSSFLPLEEILDLFFNQEDMNLSFDTIADDLPYQFSPPVRRLKIIHPIGVMAKAVWTPIPNNLGYTGIFSSGCSDAFIRLSLTRDPDTLDGRTTPSLSIKCLRSGVPCGDMVAANSIQGQDSWNFFEHDFSNHLPDVSFTAQEQFQQVRARFSTASDFPVMIGLSDLAQYDQDGNNVSFPVFPFRLVFHPTKELHDTFPAVRRDPFQEVLVERLQEPGDMYHIYAEGNPGDQIFEHIGTITTTSPATTSKFGDDTMFFAHTRKERDFIFKPDWYDLAEQILESQRAMDHAYTYPDLPFKNCQKGRNCGRIARINQS